MNSQDFLDESNMKYERTVSWMVDIANTHYPMSESDKEILKERLSKVWCSFINDCEDKEDNMEGW